MTVCLLLIGDGRDDYRARTLASLADAIDPDWFAATVEIDDREHLLGFAGAVWEGWRRALATGCDHVFHVELDFTFNRRLPLDAMVEVLETHPYLVQVALLRQPWNDAERAAGGIVKQHPDAYTRRMGGRNATGEPAHRWLEHRRFVTTNPALWPRWVLEHGWPRQPQSEGRFGLDLFASDPHLHASYWGDGSEWVRHIGDERAGHGY